MVTVNAVDDAVDDGETTTTVTVAYLSGDTSFSTVSGVVTVTTTDDDTKGFDITGYDDTKVSETGGTDTTTFKVAAKARRKVAVLSRLLRF